MHTTEHHATKFAITQGKSILHPGVAYACCLGRGLVPESVGILGRELRNTGNALYLVVICIGIVGRINLSEEELATGIIQSSTLGSFPKSQIVTTLVPIMSCTVYSDDRMLAALKVELTREQCLIVGIVCIYHRCTCIGLCASNTQQLGQTSRVVDYIVLV